MTNEKSEKVKRWVKEHKDDLGISFAFATCCLAAGMIGYRRGFQDGGVRGSQMVAATIPIIIEQCRKAGVRSMNGSGLTNVTAIAVFTDVAGYYKEPEIKKALQYAAGIMEAERFI